MNHPFSGSERMPADASRPWAAPSTPVAGLPHRRSSLRRLLIAGIAFTALALAVAWVADHALLAQSFAALHSRPWLLALFLVSYSAAFWLRAEAWHRLVPVLPRRAAFSILQSAMFVNHVLPIKAGELARPLLATRRGLALGDAAGSTLVARVVDYLALFALAAALIPAAPASPVQGAGAFGIGAGLLLAGILTLVVVRHGHPPGRGPAPLRRAWQGVGDGLRAVTPRKAAMALAWSSPSWVLESTAVLVAASSTGSQIGLLDAVAVTAFTLLFQVFHFAPGGLGVYEATMTGALTLFGLPPQEAFAVAVITHGLKFGYSFTVSAGFAAYEAAAPAFLRSLAPKWRERSAASYPSPRRALSRARRGKRIESLSRAEPWDRRGFLPKAAGRHSPVTRAASRFELIAARLWNVVNEGKPFTPAFVTGTLVILGAPSLLSGAGWPRFGLALLPLLPLAVIFYRFDFPLKLRWALWAYLLLFLVTFRYFDPLAAAVAMGLYFTFTVILWGTVYYHLRIGTPWTNFARFWRLVLENPDPTSGNFLEQAPKFLLLVLLHRYLMEDLTVPTVAGVELLILGIGLSALLLHQWLFTWKPSLSLTPTRLRNDARTPFAKRVIAIVIDGCRADRLEEAHTPFLDRLRRDGTTFTDMRTVYPARTVTAFSSMLTGARPEVHGMRSNFVPSLGLKCESVFDALRREGRTGRLVGIAHLVDAFGATDVKTVSAVNDNDAIDDALVSRAKEALLHEDPELLVLQLLSVDQTGHARGSYNAEYLDKIEATDQAIESFLGWCEREGHLEGATVLVTSDHGQGIGIGGHGHLTESERRVPCIFWGEGAAAGKTQSDPRYLIDIAPTISYLLGTLPPKESTGQVLLAPAGAPAGARGRCGARKALLAPAGAPKAVRPAPVGAKAPLAPAGAPKAARPAPVGAKAPFGPAGAPKAVRPAPVGSETLLAPAAARPTEHAPVAVIIPAYNEAENLPRTLARIPRAAVPGLHVIVVDDGSTDATEAVARHNGVETVVRHDRNRGLGAALRSGLDAVRALGARSAVYVDADGEYDPVEIPALLAPIEAGQADYVLGSRCLGVRRGQRRSRQVANWAFTGVLSVAAGRRITDGQTGFRAFSWRALDVAEIVHDYNYAQVLTLDLLHKRMRMTEVPISWRPRARGTSFVNWQYLWRVPAGMAREMWHG